MTFLVAVIALVLGAIAVSPKPKALDARRKRKERGSAASRPLPTTTSIVSKAVGKKKAASGDTDLSNVVLPSVIWNPSDTPYVLSGQLTSRTMSGQTTGDVVVHFAANTTGYDAYELLTIYRDGEFWMCASSNTSKWYDLFDSSETHSIVAVSSGRNATRKHVHATLTTCDLINIDGPNGTTVNPPCMHFKMRADDDVEHTAPIIINFVAYFH